MMNKVIKLSYEDRMVDAMDEMEKEDVKYAICPDTGDVYYLNSVEKERGEAIFKKHGCIN